MEKKYEINEEYLWEEGTSLSIEEAAMQIAQIISQMSKDPNTKVGSCIVSEDNEILSVGCNNKPESWEGDFPWDRDLTLGEENTKYPYVIHSEVNAISNYYGPKEKLDNATLYVTLFPCTNCSKQIILSGIKKVVYKDDKYMDTKENFISKVLLTKCGIEFIQYDKLQINEDLQSFDRKRL